MPTAQTLRVSFPLLPALIAISTLCLGQAPQEAAGPSSHLFILSGQSNMVGLDPDRTFAPAIAEAFGAANVVIVKDAKGGEPIHRWYKNWSLEGTKTPDSRGGLYDRLLKKVRSAIDGKDIASVTLVWMQGERDARMGYGAVYAKSLQGLVDQLSEDLSRSDIQCVVGRISDFDLPNRRYQHWTRVREAQVAFAESSSRRAWVNTDDLNDGLNRSGKSIENDLHYSVEGYETLGKRFARKAIELIRANRPHIVLVMSDDHGWGDVSYNGHPFVKTPNLDAMAKDGLVFDRFYAAAPVCSPTRASVLTGRSPIRTKVTNHGRYMRPHERTIAESLKAAGYTTGIFGKLHLGSGQPGSLCNPSGMGFDEWVVGLNFFDEDPYLSRNGTIEHRTGSGSSLVVDDALAFLNKHQGGGRPMFVVVWLPSPHDPHDEIPTGPSLYDGEKHAGYYREITVVDEQLGRLRRSLRDLGMVDDTILWYCSDNGGLVQETSGGRGRKGSIYEGGLRVPAIVEWPARKLAGRCEAPVWTCDMYPTLMAMIGRRVEFPHPLDGVDATDLMWGGSTRRVPMGFWHNFEPGQATWSDRIQKAMLKKQQGGVPLPHNPARLKKDVDEFPQFIENTARGHAAWADWPWKLHRIDGTKYELYHLADDPMEAADLSTDPDQASRFDRMKVDLDAWMRSVVRSLNGEDY